MKIAIIDADLIGKKKHRFPNLVSMKISGYYKENGYDVELITDYELLRDTHGIYKNIFLSKVFTDTEVPEWILELNNVSCGGTGFFYDKAPALPYEIEHCMPDYHLYDNWVQDRLNNGGKKNDFQYYIDYSIGFTTRGCFRHCPFCVNKNYDRVEFHSPLEEFLDSSRKKICLLDDNILGYKYWDDIIRDLQSINKPFQFKQGMDERLLTRRKCEALFESKYDGDYIFAFDNVDDYDLIESKLKLLREYTEKCPKFYVFCGFDRSNHWGNFWKQDILDMMKRVELLMNYHCIPYIMRFNRYIESPYQGVYKTVAAWCNQPSFFKKKSLREFGESSGGARNKYIIEFENICPEFTKYMDMKWE